MDSDGNKLERPRHPRANANIFEIVSFSWILNLFKTGRKRDLEKNDLYTTLKDHSSSSLGNEFEKKWRSELVNANKSNRNPSLSRTLIQMFGTKVMLYGIVFSIAEIVLKMSQPLFIGGILAFFDLDNAERSDLAHSYVYACALMLNMLITTVLYHSTQMEMLHFGMKMRIACCSAIFKKALRLSNTALGETTNGQIVNLLSNDVSRFDSVLLFLHYLWISPLQTIVATYFVWQEIGVSSIFGLVACYMFIPLQGWLGKKTSEYRLKTALRTDERVCLMNEIISGIRVIKMYTWEKPFALLVQHARKKEIQQIRGSSYVKATLTSFVAFHTKITLFFCIISYVLLGNDISAKKVFVITSYYQIMQPTLTIRFPQGIGQFAEMLISIKRIQNFLLYEEKDGRVGNRSENVCNGTVHSGDATETIFNDNRNGPNADFEIVVSNATAKWTDAQTENCLEDINLTVGSGRLVAIIGPVGAGKSSLLQAILRELPLSEGNVFVRGAVSYASQEAWLFNSSIKQNILFGSPMDDGRYKRVIKACALKTDFERFPYGDRTIVGEKGLSLSGGQRARINLARAVYKKADIYLLDDPLSAVDTRVGRHLFEKCIKGFLRDKTRVLITHQLQYLTNADQIVLVDNAKILAQGTREELEASDLDFARAFLRSSEGDAGTAGESFDNDAAGRTSGFDRHGSVRNDAFSEPEDGTTEAPAERAETRSSGRVSATVYSSYLAAGGKRSAVAFFVVVCVSSQLLASAGDLWLTHWANLEEHVFRGSATPADGPISPWPAISRRTCANVFAGLTFVTILVTVIRSVASVSLCTTASTNLHDDMFGALTRATMTFFNENSSGRILNRFSKDIGTIDDVLPVSLMDSIHAALKLVGIVTVIGITNVYFTIPTLVVAYIIYKITVYYLLTSRSVKRLEGITRSPIFAHLNASLQGLTTIRAFEAEHILSREFDNHQDLHSSAWYMFVASNRALCVWIDAICVVYISVITFTFIAIGNSAYIGNVGLAITQSLGLVGIVQWGVRQSTDLENQMTSVERVLEYSNIPQEGALETAPDEKPPSNWPHSGRITFENFYLRYGADTAYVIKNFNINIESTQKVGIVGRTGAGKSSLIAALFRLAVNEGKIIIDGVEIHGLGLHDLRSKISIIPQEPVLFSGTMRTNLDPFDEFPDHVLWDALDEVELKTVIEALFGGLNSKMSESGSNFSIGQRQLVCLARAIVRNNKILILDEATANVDPQTDALIQKTIRNKFRTCTVLTIAHRLNTVMDSDVILVMDYGQMVEFDSPRNLLKNKDGFLYKMVEQTGHASSDLLHSIAAENSKTGP